jgi:hypothetical protein
VELTAPSKTAKAPDSAFTGDVYVNPIKQKAEPSRLIASIGLAGDNSGHELPPQLAAGRRCDFSELGRFRRPG